MMRLTDPTKELRRRVERFSAAAAEWDAWTAGGYKGPRPDAAQWAMEAEATRIARIVARLLAREERKP